jgi:hypothetical protein
LVGVQLQAIGSEVAAETRRSAERNAPAMTVAVSRAEAKLIIGKPLYHFFGPDHRARATVNAGDVPIGKSLYFSVADFGQARNLLGMVTVSW